MDEAAVYAVEPVVATSTLAVPSSAATAAPPKSRSARDGLPIEIVRKARGADGPSEGTNAPAETRAVTGKRPLLNRFDIDEIVEAQPSVVMRR